MQKLKVHKSVVEQMTGKLKTSENAGKSADFAENLQNSDLKQAKKQITSKLRANENEVEKGFGKYISKKFVKGKWVYKYHQDRNVARSKINSCTSQPLKCTLQNALAKGEQFIKNWQQDWRANRKKSRCPVLGGNTVVVIAIDENGNEGISLQHFGYKGSGKKFKRPAPVIKERAEILPFAKEMLESKDKCIVNEVRTNGNQTEYEILGKAKINGKTEKICVIVSKRKNEPLTYLSIIKKAISDDTAFITDVFLVKSSNDVPFWAEQEGGITLPQPLSNISQQNNLSSKNVSKSLTYSGHKLQGRTKLYGMDISIENKKGSYRSGVDKDGHKWKVLMHYDYGYIRGTVGVDKDHLDTYVGPDKKANKVYVVHQNDPVTHKYDEDKCMLCFSSAADAKAAYMKQYDRPGFYGSMTTMTIEQFKSFIFSHKGKMVHKSFDINITDITENNKQQKLEQFSKALNAIADNRPFMIKHIPVDASKNYGNLLVRITDFDKSKIEKAVHKVALSLDTDISGASKGESYVYEAQKELAEGFFKEFTNKTRAIYNFVISYFDLPDIRIVSKAGELKHKEKILYNPETGLPIKESDWKKFVAELEKYLNRNYAGIGEKIVLSSESLGIILDRLSKTNSLEAIRKMSLSSLKTKRYDVDWISESVKNMKDTFGEVISRERQARIQIACDSAAQRVTRVSDDIRNNIQQIIIDGIRDKQSKSVVAQNLFDKCASLNRDMQRIADSEVQMAANSAYIKEEVYNSKPDEKIYFKRFEMLDDNTCKKCRKLKGTIALWSEVPLPDERIKDEYAEYAIWDGKNEGDCPVGIVHPWCRGTWVRYYPEV